MNDLTGSKVLMGELRLCNAVKDIYFTSKIKLKKLIKRFRSLSHGGIPFPVDGSIAEQK
jgi:hypothetical protein